MWRKEEREGGYIYIHTSIKTQFHIYKKLFYSLVLLLSLFSNIKHSYLDKHHAPSSQKPKSELCSWWDAHEGEAMWREVRTCPRASAPGGRSHLPKKEL